MRNDRTSMAVKATLLAVILFGTIYIAAQRVGNPIFEDYFTDGGDEGWLQVNRNWEVELGRYVVRDYKPEATGRGGWSLTHVGDRSWRDYVLEATFDITNAPGLPSPDVHTALFLVRVQLPPGTEVDLPSVGNYYGVEIWPKGTTDPRTGTGNILPGGLVHFTKHVNGEQVVTVDSEQANAVVGTNTINIVVAGKSIEVWVNGEPVLTYNDPSPIRYGGIGLAATWEAETWFDNVIVSRIRGRK